MQIPLLSPRRHGDMQVSLDFLEEGYSLLSLALPLHLKLLYLFIGMVIRKYHCIPHNLPNFVHRNLHWEGKSHLQGEG